MGLCQLGKFSRGRLAVAVLLIALVELLSLPAFADDSSSGRASVKAPERSVRLNNYNNWQMVQPSDHLDPAKLEEALRQMAKHDVVSFTECYEHVNSTPGWSKLTPRSLKAINGNIRVFRHWSTVKSIWEGDWGSDGAEANKVLMQTPVLWNLIEKNDWWLRDRSGKKVDDASSNDPGKRATMWYLDLGKPGLKEAYLQTALEKMKDKGFDGVVFDGAMQELSPWLDGRPFPKQLYRDDEDWYERAWQPFMSYVVQGFRQAHYTVVENCGGQYASGDPKKEWNRSQVDGVIYEQGAVGWQGEWLPPAWIEERINAIAADPLEVWVDDGGLTVKNTGAEYDRKAAVSLAMYYVAIPVSQAKRSYHNPYKGYVHWQPLWDFHIGDPAEPSAKMPGKYFWSRKYTKGIVLLNYESSGSIDYTLARSYRDLSGKTYSGGVSVPAHTGMILGLDG